MSLGSMILHLMDATLTNELIERTKRPNRLLLNATGRTTKALITTAIAKKEERPLLVIVPTLEEASRWFSILQLLGWTKTLFYPTSEGSPYDSFDCTSEITWGQLQVLSELISPSKDNDIAIIATDRSLQPHLPPKSILKDRFHKITRGESLDLQDLSNLLTELGYERLPNVEQEGSWSRRGDIVDIFPVSNELPVRLEFFGDQLDKLREFDPATQRSLDAIDQIYLTPISFNPIIADKLREDLPSQIEDLLDSKSVDQLIEGNCPEGMRRLMGLAWEKPNSLLEYLPEHSCVVIDEVNQCLAHGEKWVEHTVETYRELLSNIHVKRSSTELKFPPSLHKDVQLVIDSAKKFYGFDLSDLTDNVHNSNSFDASSRRTQYCPNQFGKLAQQIKSYQKDKFKIWLLSAQPTRTASLLKEHDCFIQFVNNQNDHLAITRLLQQDTPVALKSSTNAELEGLVLPTWKIVLLTDREFYGQQNLSATGYIRRRRGSTSKTINPTKMRSGDYVVHRNHGIGKFIKIEKHAYSGEIRDYLVVEYLDGRLSVAADQLGSLGRYRATDGKTPKINKMGGANWNRTKEKVRKHLQKVAIDLVKLYAQRSESKGYAFPEDGPWQNELEDSFPYEPTPDQLKAVSDVKHDMQNHKPMDRLICGDVGFGKTEVAIRAIFKAITAGKQVALLAPTTVLSQQHWQTVSERFAPYPIKVGLLNRFKNTNERKEIMDQLKTGKMDAVIGTHQLLSNKVLFKNLALLVIDEEQRFGVAQKEKIKTLKKDIDVLTLSATPIPRTLYMSMSGVREMSLITTPPPLRRPIKTHLSPIDDEVIRSAICQELDRGGQIFYVVPRVEGIIDVADKLKTMIPNLKLIIAHGQMNEGELESSMIAFNAGEADLMLCTTIIESGLDIPRVNTILIEDGHKFGLSQLYQLRGRVGRSGIQAHAWIFYPSNSILNSSARQRLRAIQEFAQLGSGYQLAMRDMEIRGVGNLLGVEQSGQMESIGFDLYMELLQEALADIQGQNIPTVEEAQIDLQVTAFIPGDWIENSDEKIAAYRSAAECSTKELLVELATIWSDRYGTIPKAVQTLLEIMKLKLLAKQCGFSRIKQIKNNLVMETSMEQPAFRLLRKGLPEHLRGRLIYNSGNGISPNVVCRGLGILEAEKQVETLIDWFTMMVNKKQNEYGVEIDSEVDSQKSADILL